MSYPNSLISSVKTIELTPEGVRLLDQTCLPNEIRYVTVTTPEAMADAIQRMIIRGAPAIGIAGAFGVVLSARCHRQRLANTPVELIQAILQDIALLESTRPTAVNLQWALNRLRDVLAQNENASAEQLSQRLEAEALKIFAEDLAMCLAIGQHGASLIPKGARILTHCNAGALATAGYGTALGVVRSAFAHDPTIQVFADETRPRLQGARLTTWEMVQEGIPVTLISDNMSAWAMKQGKIDVVIVGADRIATNGDTANKIGTYLLALAAKAHEIPFYVAAPSSTIDLSIASGTEIPIEERADAEVSVIHDQWICPADVSVYNPAFDVTPSSLITAIITEKGVFRPPFHQSLRSAD